MMRVLKKIREHYKKEDCLNKHDFEKIVFMVKQDIMDDFKKQIMRSEPLEATNNS